MSLPDARLIAVSLLSLGMFSALALRIAVRSLELESGSDPPSVVAIVIVRDNLGKTFDILSHRFSFEALRYSNARPIDGRNLDRRSPISNQNLRNLVRARPRASSERDLRTARVLPRLAGTPTGPCRGRLGSNLHRAPSSARPGPLTRLFTDHKNISVPAALRGSIYSKP